MACDILVLAPHPDDAELHVGGTIAAQVRLGARVVVVDATAGEAGSLGDPATRRREAEAAADVLGLDHRRCLGLPDGGLFALARTDLLRALVECLRTERPGLVLTIAGAVRHPDHLGLAEASWAAMKTAALHRWPGATGAALPGARCLCYEAELQLAPDLLVPCTDADWQRKRAALACYGSQFAPPTGAPVTTIGQPGFLAWIDGRGRVWGQQANAPYAEAFQAPEPPVLADLRLLGAQAAQ